MKFKLIEQWLWVSMALLLCLMPLMTPLQSVSAQQTTSTTYAAYQEFERGVMVWREDTGEILVFLWYPNILYRFPEAVYDHLSDNPAPEEPPPGLVKPIRGFGRVWGNFPYVRTQLGWGIISEYGYTATTSVGLSYSWEKISLPDGSVMEYFLDNYWYQHPSPPPPPTLDTHTTIGAIQPFSNGIMLYAADSGTIWVLSYSGSAHTFRTQDYGFLPNNPVWEAPPPGYVKPILGFGKVWGNFPYIRHDLGWALAYENSYVMEVGYTPSPSSATIRLPDGSWVALTADGGWHYR